MHNVWTRLNSVVFFALTVLLAMAVMTAFSTYLHEGSPSVKVLKVSKLKTLRNHAGVDRALMTLDIEADFRAAFNWNVKQLFVYVVAEYESKKNPLNQIVVWDKIVESKDDAYIKLKRHSVKYALIDQGAELRNKTINFVLAWDHMPYTGRLYQGRGDDVESKHKYKFPGKYKLSEN